MKRLLHCYGGVASQRENVSKRFERLFVAAVGAVINNFASIATSSL